VLTQTAKPVGHQHEAEEAEEHRVELFEAGEDPTVAVESPEQALALSTRARNNYFFARGLVGQEVTVPTVECRELDAARFR
jgi:hypothetical protein